jgi:hypothetical protein
MSNSTTRTSRNRNRSQRPITVRQTISSRAPENNVAVNNQNVALNNLPGPTGNIGPQGPVGSQGHNSQNPPNYQNNDDPYWVQNTQNYLDAAALYSSMVSSLEPVNTFSAQDSSISLDDFPAMAISTFRDAIADTAYSNVSYTPPYRPSRDDNNTESGYINSINDYNNEKSSFLLIKNRSLIFKSFISAVKQSSVDLFENNTPSIESRRECKKRVKFWASKLFDPVTIYIHKLLFIPSNSNNVKDGTPKWIDIEGPIKIIPVGVDIWGTYGGVLQSNETQIEWEKSLLMFLPNKKLLTLVKDFGVDIFFTNAGSIKIINNQCNTPETQQRKIQL